VVCLWPRDPGEIVGPRPLSDVGARPLNFTVRLHVENARHPTPAVRDEPGVLLGLSLIALLIALLAVALALGLRPGPMQPGAANVFGALYLLAWGVMFLCAYFFSRKTFFFRALLWVCYHLSYPRGKGMALFYAALAFIIGGIALVSGLGLV